MKSIKRDITLSLIVAITLLLAISSFGLQKYLRHVLEQDLDDALLKEAVSLSAVTMQEPDGQVEFELNPEATPHYLPSNESHYYQVWYSSGDLLARSPSLKDRDLPRGMVTSFPSLSDLTLPDGRVGRSVELRFVPLLERVHDANAPALSPPPAPPAMFIVVARERESLNNTLATITSCLLGGTIFIAASGALVVFLVVTRGTRPLRRLADHVDAIQPEVLSRRLVDDGQPAELRPIVEKLNAMLERVETAMNRERRFRADAAHELRTPVAELRTLAEVFESMHTDDPETAMAFSDVKDIAIRMESLIVALLELARRETGPPTLDLKSIDLCTIVREVVKSLEHAAAAKTVVIKLDLLTTVVVNSDPVMIRAYVRNVLSNAVDHSTTGSTVQCTLEASETDVILLTTNQCQGLKEDDLTHIGDPFWRKDESRSGGQHFGLGGTLINAYAHALSAEHSVELINDNQFVTRLRLPVN